jgi:hypothetical protein
MADDIFAVFNDISIDLNPRTLYMRTFYGYQEITITLYDFYSVDIPPTPPHKLPRPFKFKDFMPKPFRVIRSLYGIDEGDFMQSVAGIK